MEQAESSAGIYGLPMLPLTPANEPAQDKSYKETFKPYTIASLI